MQNDGDGQPPQAATEPSGRGYKRNGPHSRDRGRVREKLKNPPATVNHLGLLLNLLQEGRRRTGRSADTVADFKNLSRKDGPHSRDRDRFQEYVFCPLGKLKNPPATVDHLRLLLNLPEEEMKNMVRKTGTVAAFKNLSRIRFQERKAEDGPHIRDLGRVHGILESPPVTDDHLGLLLNLREEARS
ncbi:hypothetical protein pipiens_016229 [Culex pipiens pipiens]|uniref:Uncharacterized protein n=1 Tax=Culex pipiens pipiens TaxID=38569 RepID=A0ABD1CM53_CULPP